MRDRLIEKISIMEEMVVDPKANFKITDVQRILRQAREMLEKAIIPPCKVGDIVKCDAIYYRVYRTQTYSDFETPTHHRYWAEPIHEEGEDDFWFWDDKIEEGTVVVCTREEAEQALKEGAE